LSINELSLITNLLIMLTYDMSYRFRATVREDERARMRNRARQGPVAELAAGWAAVPAGGRGDVLAGAGPGGVNGFW
jgi:hypothetical protein